VDQQYGRQGQADYVYYTLASSQTSPNYVFNDVTTGNNGVPCLVDSSDPDCPSTGWLQYFSAAPGYDLASGLGSVNAANLFQQWDSAVFRSTTTTLEVTNPAGGTANLGQAVTLTASVYVPSSQATSQEWGPPLTGQTVAFSDASNSTQLGTATLAYSASTGDFVATFTTSSLTLGAHNITATFPGNSSSTYYGSSTSAPVTVTVQQPSSPTGTIQVNATFNGAPWSGPASFQLTGASTLNGTSLPATFSIVTAGNYTLNYIGGGPSGATVTGVAPGVTQTLSGGATATYTLNFTTVLTGTIQVNGTLNGTPWQGSVSYQLVGPITQSGTWVPATFTMPVGNYTLTYSGGTYGATLSSVTPSATQTLNPWGLAYTLNLTAPKPSYTLAVNGLNKGTVASTDGSINCNFGGSGSSGACSASYGVDTTVTLNATAAGSGTFLGWSGPCTWGNPCVLVMSRNMSPTAIFTQNTNTYDQHYRFNRADFPTGTEPQDLAAGDFNGDGKLDLVTANFSANTISVLLGNGDGTFQSHVDYATGSGPWRVATGDFNGDGNLDLAVTNFNDGTVSIFLGNGDGTFRSQVTYPAGPGPWGVVVADFNGDGNLDLAIANYWGNAISILLGNGDGTFQAAVGYAAGAAPQDVLIGDFNGDGKLDVAVADFNGNAVSVLLGNGDGTFQSAMGFATGTKPNTLAAGDFNGDGYLDLAVSNSSDHTVSVLLGNGNGTFQTHVDYAVPLTPVKVIAGDFDGDGKLDLVLGGVDTTASGAPTSPVVILHGNGDGTFQNAVAYTTGVFMGSFLTADFNGDGKTDLAIADSWREIVGSLLPGNAVTVLLANAGGGFNPRTDYATGAAPGPVVIADFNGDGKPDLAVGNFNDNTVSVLLGKGDGTFQTHVDYPTGAKPSSVTVGDFNGDGKLDLATANLYGGSVSILLGNGDGTFQSHVDYPVGSEPFAVAIGDFNGDGKLDLAVANDASSTVSILLGRGDGTFETHVDYATGLNPFSVAVGDFNGDGKLDLAVANETSSTVSIFLGKGDGTFNTRVDYPTGFSPTYVAVADFNGDGKLDLAVANSGDNTVSILLGNGEGTFQPRVDYETDFGPVSVTVCDLNQDGKLDLAIRTVDSTSVLIGNGDGTFNTRVDYPVGVADGGIPQAAVADLNGKGWPALVVPNAYSTSDGQTAANTVSVLQQTPVIGLFPSTLSFGGQLLSTASSPRAVTVSNPGTIPLTISNIAVTGEFSETNNCGSGLPVGGKCTISVDFSPTSTGPGAGAVTITDNSSTSPHQIPLSGTGAVTTAQLSTTSLSFANQVSGTTSAPQPVTLSNTGSAPLSITAIVVTGDFAQSNNCGSSLSAGSNCTINVTFTPTATGKRTGNVTITDDAFNSPQAVALSGTGVASPPTLSPSSLNFPNQAVGTTGTAQAVTLSNPGIVALSLTSIVFSGTNAGDYAQSNTCGSSVAAGGTCTISVTFTPTAGGTRTATLAITDNALNSPQAVGVTGTGTGPAVGLSPSSLTFSLRLVGSTSDPQAVTLTNTGNAPLSISSIVASGDFSRTNTCGSSVGTGSSCTINVTFTPTANGTRTGNLNITDSAWNSPQTVTLTGEGAAPIVALSPSSLVFPSQLVGTTSASEAVTLNNTGWAWLQISSITASGDFSETNNCGSGVGALSSCTINVTFTPEATGTRTGALTVTDDNNVVAGSTQSVSLTGTGAAQWQQMPGLLSQVSVGSDGTVWGINSAGQVYMFNPQTQTWQQAPGLLTQVVVGSSGFVWALNAAGQIYRYDPTLQSWDQIPGALSQIAVGSDGDVWGINSSAQVYHFNSATQTWSHIPGALAQIAVGYDGAIWGINAAQQIYRFNPGTQNWQQIPGALKRVAVGADGDVWGINNADQTYHFNSLSQQWNNAPGSLAQIAVGSASNVWGIDAVGAIWRFNAQAQAWNQIPGQLAQIGVGANGAVWGVNSANQIYQFVQPTQPTQTLHQVPGLYAQIAAGIDGEVWAIDATQQVWGYDAQQQGFEQIPGTLSEVRVGFGGNVWGLNAAGQILQFNPSTQTWNQILGSLAQLEVGADGSVWGIDSAGRIWRFNPSTHGFQQIPGSLAQLGVGADGTVWGINSVGQIWRFNPSTQGWQQIPGSLAQIAVGSANNVWGLNAAGQIWRYDPQLQTWDSIPGALTSIGVAFDGTVWGLNSANQIWRFNAQTQSWDSIPGGLSQVSVGADAVVWGLNASGQAYQYW